MPVPEVPPSDARAALVARYRDALPARAVELAALAEDARAAGWDHPSRSNLADFVHRLAGSAAVYGFADLSAALAAAEPALRGDGDVHEAGERVTRLVAALRDAAAG